MLPGCRPAQTDHRLRHYAIAALLGLPAPKVIRRSIVPDRGPRCIEPSSGPGITGRSYWSLAALVGDRLIWCKKAFATRVALRPGKPLMFATRQAFPGLERLCALHVSAATCCSRDYENAETMNSMRNRARRVSRGGPGIRASLSRDRTGLLATPFALQFLDGVPFRGCRRVVQLRILSRSFCAVNDPNHVALTHL